MEPAEIAVGILVREDRVLVTRRAGPGPYQGFDEFPGGHREPAESLEDCLRREVFEETGFRIEVDALYATKFDRHATGGSWLWFFLCRPLAKDPHPGGSAVLPRWVPRPGLAGLRFPPANARVVDLLVRGAGAAPR